jgi:addiction module HigA family antidote
MSEHKQDFISMPHGGWNIRSVTTHPGEIVREEFLLPLGLSANKLALDLHVPVTRISEIIHERRVITADTALRLRRYFGMSPEFWVKLQNSYDLSEARSEISKQIEMQVRPRSAA